MTSYTEATELLDLVRSINHQINSVLNQYYAPYGLTRPQAIVLTEVEHGGPVSLSTLAQRLNMTTSNLCLIAQRLEKSGFLLRQRDPSDQRSVLLEGTGKTHELIGQIQAHVDCMVRLRLNHTDPENFDKIMEGLRLLNAVMAKEEDRRNTHALGN